MDEASSPTPTLASVLPDALDSKLSDSFGLRTKVATLVATALSFAALQAFSSLQSGVLWLLKLLWTDVLSPPLNALGAAWLEAYILSLSETEIAVALACLAVLASLVLGLVYWLRIAVLASLYAAATLPAVALGLLLHVPLPHQASIALASLPPAVLKAAMPLGPLALCLVAAALGPAAGLAVTGWACVALLPWPELLHTYLPAKLSYMFVCTLADGAPALCRFVTDPKSPLHLAVAANAPLMLGDLLAAMYGPGWHGEPAAQQLTTPATLMVFSPGPLGVAAMPVLYAALAAAAATGIAALVLWSKGHDIAAGRPLALARASAASLIVVGVVLASASLSGTFSGPPLYIAESLRVNEAIDVLTNTHPIHDVHVEYPRLLGGLAAGNFTGSMIATAATSRWGGRVLAHGTGVLALSLDGPGVGPASSVTAALRGTWDMGRIVSGRLEVRATNVSVGTAQLASTEDVDAAIMIATGVWEEDLRDSLGVEPWPLMQALGRQAVAWPSVSGVASVYGVFPIRDGDIHLLSSDVSLRIAVNETAASAASVRTPAAVLTVARGTTVSFVGPVGPSGGQGSAVLHVVGAATLSSSIVEVKLGRGALYSGPVAEWLPLIPDKNIPQWSLRGTDMSVMVDHRTRRAVPTGMFAGIPHHALLQANGNVTCVTGEQGLACDGTVTALGDDGYTYRGGLKGSARHGPGKLYHLLTGDALYGVFRKGRPHGSFVRLDPVTQAWVSLLYAKGGALEREKWVSPADSAGVEAFVDKLEQEINRDARHPLYGP